MLSTDVENTDFAAKSTGTRTTGSHVQTVCPRHGQPLVDLVPDDPYILPAMRETGKSVHQYLVAVVCRTVLDKDVLDFPESLVHQILNTAREIVPDIVDRYYYTYFVMHGLQSFPDSLLTTAAINPQYF